MTFEEAKKKIADCVKLCTDDYNRYEDEFMRGEAAAYKNALAILNGIDTDHELSRNPEQLTLKELARELRRLFRFKYLTVDPYADEITFWMDKPEWVCDSWWAGDSSYLFDFYANRLNAYLDLSEYKDADGNIDYSKCLVEVE